MNTQEKEELVNQLNIHITNCPSDSWDRGYNEGIKSAITVVRNRFTADEPQNVKVPTCVDKYLNYCMKMEMSLAEALKREISSGVYGWYSDEFKFIDEALGWLESSMNQNIFADAWLNGWETEEEPKWIVCYSTMYLKEPLGDTSDFSVNMTWKKEYAYKFDSEEAARNHVKKLGGTVEKV